MLLVVAGEALLTLGLIAITIAVLGGEGRPAPETRLWAGLAWTTWLILVVFALWNRRGVWTAHTESARSFIALSEERARRRVRAASFLFGFTALLGVVIALLGWFGTATGAVILLYLGGALGYGRRARRELASIRRIAAEFDA